MSQAHFHYLNCVFVCVYLKVIAEQQRLWQYPTGAGHASKITNVGSIQQQIIRCRSRVSGPVE